MKTVTLTQSEARGYFLANTKSVVIEFVINGQSEPLEITGSRGISISNGSALKRLDQLANPQKYLFDNYDSRTKETRCGFVRWIPEGQEADVELRVTECDNETEAVIVSKYFRDTKLSKNRTMRRDIQVNSARGLRMVGCVSNLMIDRGITKNIALKAA
jgi:hypothetical protein